MKLGCRSWLRVKVRCHFGPFWATASGRVPARWSTVAVHRLPVASKRGKHAGEMEQRPQSWVFTLETNIFAVFDLMMLFATRDGGVGFCLLGLLWL